MARRRHKPGPRPLPARERRRRHLARIRHRARRRRSRTVDVARLRELDLVEVGAFASVVFARFKPQRKLAPAGLLVLCNTEQLGSDRRHPAPSRRAA